MTTEELVYSMLVENTGVHFLDSGGSNGRMWQRNANKSIDDFRNEPIEKLEFDTKRKELYRTVSVFHYLSELELDDICNKFNSINSNTDNWYCDSLYGVSSEAWEYLSSLGVKVNSTINTYNYDSDLSQILQYSHVEIDGEDYYVMQIHNGADARGGYTDAKLFKSRGSYEAIHPYVSEYMDSYELQSELSEGYIIVRDYNTGEDLSCDEVIKMLKD